MNEQQRERAVALLDRAVQRGDIETARELRQVIRDMPQGSAPVADDMSPGIRPFYGAGDERNPPAPAAQPVPVTPIATEVVPGLRVSAEEAVRRLRLGTQSVADAAAGIIGLPSDAVVGSARLAREGLNFIPGVDLPQVPQSPVGSQAARDLYEFVPGGRIAQEDMTPEERAISNATTFAAEGFAGGAALARRAGSRLMADRSTANIVQRTLDTMGEPYLQQPGRVAVVDAAAATGAAAGLEAGSAIGGDIGGTIGALGGALVGGGVATGGMTGVDFVRSQQRDQRFPELSQADAEQMVQRVQRAVTAEGGPSEAADNLSQMRRILERNNITPPDAGAMARDQGLSVIASIYRRAFPGRSAADQARFMEDVSDFLQQPISERNRFSVLPDANAMDSELRRFTNFANERRRSIRAGAQEQFQSAESNLDQARQNLENIGALFNARAERRGPASTEMQSMMTNLVEGRRSERAALYEAARRSDEAAASVIDSAPVIAAYRSALASERAGGVSVRSVLPADSDVRPFLDAIAENPQAANQFNYRRLGNYINQLQDQYNGFVSAGETARAKQLEPILNAMRGAERSLADATQPVSAALREARQYQIEEWAPFFEAPRLGSQQGNVIGADIAQDQLRGAFAQGRGAETFAQDYIFRRAQTNPQEAASDIIELMNISQNPQQFATAAGEYLVASAARSMASNGRINQAVLERWYRDHAPILSMFPDAERTIQVLMGDVRVSADQVEAARNALQAARGNVRLTDRQIADSWISLAADAAPTNAARSILSAKDAPRRATEVMQDLREFGDETTIRAMQDSVLRYISDSARQLNSPQLASGSEYATSLSGLNREIMRSRGALDVLLRGRKDALRALEDTREMLEMAQYTRAAGQPERQPPTMAEMLEQTVVRSAELPARLMFGHLEAGGKIRSLRLGLQRIPGLNNRDAVDNAIVNAFSDPDYLERVLRAEQVPPVVRQDVLTRWRLLRAAMMGEEQDNAGVTE